MGAPPDYKVVSRHTPFTGISSANSTAGDVTAATEMVNVNFDTTTDEKDATLVLRPGLKKLATFSEPFRALVPYQELVVLGANASNTLSARAAAAAPGMGLCTEKSAYIFMPVLLTLANPLQHRIAFSNSVLYVDGVLVSISGSTVTGLMTTLSAYSITLDTYTTQNGFSTKYWPTEAEATDSILLSSLMDVNSSGLRLELVGRSLLPTCLSSAANDTRENLPIAAKFPVYRASLYPWLFAIGPTGFSTGLPMFCDGAFLGASSLVAAASTVTGNGAGTNYYEFATQAIYDASQSTSQYATSQEPASYVIGPLSARKTLASSVGEPFIWTITTTNSQRGFGCLSTDFLATNLVTTGLKRLVYRNGKPTTGLAKPGRISGTGSINGTNAGAIWLGGGSAGDYQSLTSVGSGLAGDYGIGINGYIRFWRTKAQTSAADAAAAPLYLVDDGVPATSTTSAGTYTSSTADASLTQVYLPRPIEPDNLAALPSLTTCVTYHQGRVVFGTYNGQLLFSLPDEPFNYSNVLRQQISDAKIMSLVSVNAELYIFSDDGIYILSGSVGTLDSTLQKVSTTTVSTEAFYNSSSATVMDLSVIFAGDDLGVYAVGNKIVRIPNIQLEAALPIVQGVNSQDDAVIASTLGTTTISRRRVAYSAADRKVFFGVIGSRNMDVLDAQFRWFKYTLPSPLVDISIIASKATFLLEDPSGSAVWQLDPTLSTDDGSSITFKYASQWEDLGDPRTEKQFAKIQVDLAQGVSQNGTLTVTTEYDYLPGKTGTTIDFPLRVDQGWGNNAWGTTPWGDKNQTSVVIPLTNEKHRSMRVIFEGTQNLAISGWSIEVIGAGAHAKNGVASSAPSGT